MVLTTTLEATAINDFKGCFMSPLQTMMKLLLAPLKDICIIDTTTWNMFLIFLHAGCQNSSTAKTERGMLPDIFFIKTSFLCNMLDNNQSQYCHNPKCKYNHKHSSAWENSENYFYGKTLFFGLSSSVDTCLSARSISTPWAQGTAGLARQSPLFALLVKSMRCLCK